MKFFFDENTSPKWVTIFDALDGAYNQSDHINKKFGPVVTDQIWISKLQSEGDWIIITGDIKMKTNPGVRIALRQSNITVFFLKPSWQHNRKLLEQTWRLIKLWPDIVDKASRHPCGAWFEAEPNRLQKIK